MKKASALLLIMALGASLMACAPKKEAPKASDPPALANTEAPADIPEDVPEDDAEEYFTCLISEEAAGAPFTDLTWGGFERIKADYGAEIKLVEALDKAEYAEQIRAMAEMGANPIYTMFDAVNEVAIEIAPEYPDTIFYLIDSSKDTLHDNVANVNVDPFEPAFISGIVAANSTESGKVGWIGNLDIPVINRFRDGYVAGVNYAKPDLEVLTAYIGDSSDTVKASETTKIIADQGADVIFQSANMAGLGVIQACGELGIKAIGVDEWQGDIDQSVFWSSLTDIEGAVYDSFTAFKNDAFVAGRTDYGVKTDSAIFDDRDYNNLTDTVKAEVDKAMTGIKDGSIQPESYMK